MKFLKGDFYFSCELCGEEFKTSVNKARDKSVHLLGHFRESVTKVLPNKKPYVCPKCTFTGRDLSDLSRHYGHSHRAIFTLMQKELGERWKLDENETNDCQVRVLAFEYFLCSSTSPLVSYIGGSPMLMTTSADRK